MPFIYHRRHQLLRNIKRDFPCHRKLISWDVMKPNYTFPRHDYAGNDTCEICGKRTIRNLLDFCRNCQQCRACCRDISSTWTGIHVQR